jgi:hypothetical protein
MSEYTYKETSGIVGQHYILQHNGFWVADAQRCDEACRKLNEHEKLIVQIERLEQTLVSQFELHLMAMSKLEAKAKRAKAEVKRLKEYEFMYNGLNR